jgi:bacterial/archaeal transporter family-2 protein
LARSIPFLLAVGGLLALQAGANVQLSAAMRSPFAASTLQLAIGALVLLVAAAGAGTLCAFGLISDVRPAELVGGLGSALYITAGIVLFPRLGAVVTVGFLIAGQMLASLLLDGLGWLGVEPEALGAPELAGAVAVVVGAALIVRAQGGRVGAQRLPWLALAVAAGAVLPVQGAINAQLRADLDAPVTVGAFSFLVATAAMAAALLVALALAAPRPRVEPLRRVPWWGWLGGLCGAIYVTSVFLLIPEIGVAPTVALTVAGQQLASLLVDRYGLLRLPRRSLSPVRLAGVAILLAGVALIQVA